jgi:hypothetical protein
MIIVKLEGGHSNQLFQYATGRRLAEHLGVELFMDNHWFSAITEDDTSRFYELGDYKLPQKFISRDSFALVEDKAEDLKARFYGLTKGRLKPRVKHIREKGHLFDTSILDLSDNVFLDGYWQNENYFKDIRPLLLKQTELKTKLNAKNSNWLKEVKDSYSVSLHIRRGDYVENKNTNKFHGVMSIDYYKKALEFVAKNTSQKNLKLFVFSNDIDWCKQNLKFAFPTTFIDGKNSGAEDMRLMKHCKHNIMANSSFSWWGAWLNQNPDKIVIAPKIWFQDKQANAETDIVPRDWIRL